MPADHRRALVACAAWLISGYCGIALVAAGFASLSGPLQAWSATLVVAFGAALALNGFVRAHRRIGRGHDRPV